MAFATPMMRQYLEIKSQFPDAILFFRLGDFYEMFMEDAVTASRVLDITLTSRNKGAAEEVPLCGIPFHSCQPYISRLVENGYKVAICEQVEDPKTAKGIVRREVVRVVTPGLVVDTDTLQPKENNYLLALASGGGRWGVAGLDITTGEFRVTECTDPEGIRSEVASLNPREVLLPEGQEGESLRQALAGVLAGRMLNMLPEEACDPERAERRLLDFFACASLEAFGCAGLPGAVAAAGAIIHYLGETQKGALNHIRSLRTCFSQDFMVLDETTRRHLELTATLHDGSRRGSLLGVLDRTVTAMGGRKLRQWIHQPLINVEEIRQRHRAVAELVEESLLRAELRECLDGVYDLERLNGKISMASANAKDLAALRHSLQQLPPLLSALEALAAPLLADLRQNLDPLPDVVALIAASDCR